MAALACSGFGPNGDSLPPEQRPLPEVIEPSETIPRGEEAEYSPDGLVRVPTPGPLVVFVKPPRPHLQRYDSMILAEPTLTYRRGTQPWSRREERQILDTFHQALLDTISKGEFWERTNTRGPGTLIVKATVAELDLDTDANEASTSSATSFVTPGGGAVLGFELFDSTTEQTLMRFLERRRLPGGVYSGSNVDQQRLRVLFRDFAQHLGEALRYQYRIIQEIERREREEGS